jgi:hypothetical protein
LAVSREERHELDEAEVVPSDKQEEAQAAAARQEEQQKRAAQIENVKSNARRIEYETLAREPMILDEM